MKNSKDYSKKIQKFYHALARKHAKIEKVSDMEVTDSIVYAMVSCETTERAAGSVARRLGEHFVDWNDLRAAQTEEIVEVLNKDVDAAQDVASNLVKVLNGIFNHYHTVSLENLKKAGKRPARQALEKIEGISRFAVDYCMLTSLKGHAIPLTAKMVRYLRDNDLVDPDADEQQIAGFLTKQVPAKDGYEFYVLLRHESEAREGTGQKVKTSTGKKTRKKTTTKKRTKTKKVKKAKK